MNTAAKPYAPAEVKAARRLARLRTPWGGSVLSSQNDAGAITKLDLQATECEAEDFAALAELKEVETINCMGPFAEDRSFEAFAQLPKLRTLHVTLKHDAFLATQVTDAGIAFLANHPLLGDLVVKDAELTDQACAALQALPMLHSLTLHTTREFTNVALPPLARLPNLGYLTLKGTIIDDDGLLPLAQLPTLRWLSLDGSQVRGPGLAALQKLKEFKSLGLSNSALDDAGFASFSILKKLGFLHIDSCSLSDAGLENLSQAGGLPKLAQLHFDNVPITGTGIRHLAGFPKLKELWLQHCPLEKAAVASIGECKQLKEVFLQGTPLTAEDVAALKKHLPKCRIRQ